MNSSANFTWQADLGSLQERLNAAVERLGDASELFENIATGIRGQVSDRFETKTDPNGEPWAELKGSTLARYAREDGDGGRQGSILQRTDDMLESLAANHGADFAEIGFSDLVKGGAYEKSVLHEFGTKHMARRGILTADPDAGTLGADDQATISDLVDRYMAGLLDAP